jgi:hypothetical protein
MIDFFLLLHLCSLKTYLGMLIRDHFSQISQFWEFLCNMDLCVKFKFNK